MFSDFDVMNILQIAPVERKVPPSLHGGIERIVYNLVEGLCQRGHHVTLLASANSETSATLFPLIDTPLLDDLSRAADLKSREAYFTTVIAKAVDFARHREFDVVHNHLGWRLLPFARFVDSPFVTTLQIPLNSAAKDTVFADSGGSAIVSVSQQQRLARPNLNYVATVYNGIDLSLYQLGKGDGGYLVFLGRMAPEKGPLEAINLARAIDKPLIMAAAIHPWEATYFREEVLPQIDHKKVRFIGEVDDRQKNELLGGAEALLNPIQWDEPFGISTIEAMACGTPVLALLRGAMPEIVSDRVTGILGSSIEELAQRFIEVKSIDRVACRARVKSEFSSERMVESYLEVYRRL